MRFVIVTGMSGAGNRRQWESISEADRHFGGLRDT